MCPYLAVIPQPAPQELNPGRPGSIQVDPSLQILVSAPFLSQSAQVRQNIALLTAGPARSCAALDLPAGSPAWAWSSVLAPPMPLWHSFCPPSWFSIPVFPPLWIQSTEYQPNALGCAAPAPAGFLQTVWTLCLGNYGDIFYSPDPAAMNTDSIHSGFAVSVCII